MHDIQHRDYDDSADLEMDMDAEQAKTVEEITDQVDNTPVVNTSSSTTVQPPSNDAQALNLTTSTSTPTNVRAHQTNWSIESISRTK